MFRILCVFCLLFVGYHAFDQILPPAFKKIFPYASDSYVWKLTFRVNRAHNTSNAVTIMTDWAHYYWRTQNATLNPKNKLSSQSFAVNQAKSFIYHRESVREFLRFMYRSTRDQKYFTKKEAEKMREIFWKADKISKCDYTSTRIFFTSSPYFPSNFGAEFEKISSSFYDFNVLAASRLNWTLHK